MDETRLRQERRSRANMRDRMLGQAGYDGDNDEPQVPKGDENNARRTRGAGGDDDLRRAIEESKRSLVTESSEDADLARAIKLSEEEEARRKATLADSGSLFDEP